MVLSAYLCGEGGLRHGLDDMAAWRRAIELSFEDADVERLTAIAQ